MYFIYFLSYVIGFGDFFNNFIKLIIFFLLRFKNYSITIVCEI